jgi:hypothetical protein
MDRIQIINLAKWVGIVCGALTALGAAVALAAPIIDGILQSGPLPLVGEVSMTQLGTQLQTLQQSNDRIISRLDQADTRNDQRDLEWYQFQLQQTLADAGPRPSRSVQQSIQNLKDRINQIRSRLKFPPIQ